MLSVSNHVFSEILLHINWHCKRDYPLLKDGMEAKAHRHIENYCMKTKGVRFLGIGGTETHIHLVMKCFIRYGTKRGGLQATDSPFPFSLATSAAGLWNCGKLAASEIRLALIGWLGEFSKRCERACGAKRQRAHRPVTERHFHSPL